MVKISVSSDKNKQGNNFTSAMGDLRGILDKEGINIASDPLAETAQKNTSEIPTLSAKFSHSFDEDSLDENSFINDSNNVTKQSDHIQPSSEAEIPCLDNEIKLPVLTGTITVIDEIDPVSDSVDLDDYISDFEDEHIELTHFADSVQELEKTVEAITEPEHLYRFEQDNPSDTPTPKTPDIKTINASKEKLQKQLTLQIETAVDELKIKLINSMTSEINQLFNTLSKK